jgi:enoyl-CoA hydratase/carnithine racemase
MRTGRGYFCMPEIDMKANLHPGMTAIIQARLPRQTAHEVIVTGTRYPAEAALARQIVQHAVPEAEVLSKAMEIAAPLAGKADPVMSILKADMYPAVLEAMRESLGA